MKQKDFHQLISLHQKPIHFIYLKTFVSNSIYQYDYILEYFHKHIK